MTSRTRIRTLGSGSPLNRWMCGPGRGRVEVGYFYLMHVYLLRLTGGGAFLSKPRKGFVSNWEALFGREIENFFSACFGSCQAQRDSQAGQQRSRRHIPSLRTLKCSSTRGLVRRACVLKTPSVLIVPSFKIISHHYEYQMLSGLYQYHG